MGKRQSIEWKPKGLWKSGDPAKTPPGYSDEIKNLFIRPGRHEMRPGWLRDTESPEFPLSLHKFVDTASDKLIASGTGGTGPWVRTSAGAAYTDQAILLGALLDSTNAFDKFYAVTQAYSGQAAGALYYDGATTDVTPFVSSLSGRTTEFLIRRIFIGAPFELYQGLGDVAFQLDDATYWTEGGATGPSFTTTGTVLKVTYGGTDDTLKTTSAVFTSGAAETYVTVSFDFQAVQRKMRVPLTISVENAAGTDVYAEMEIELPNSTEWPDWQRYWLTARVPASTAVYAKITAGTASKAAVAGQRFNVSDTANGKGFNVAEGRYKFNTPAISTFSAGGYTESYPNRIIWCETDDPTNWRANNYYDCNEVAGSITVLRTINRQLFAFKRNACWIFNPTPDPDNPLQLQDIAREFGCVGPKAIQTFESKLYFIGEGEVYEWGGNGQAQPLAGDRMREALFNSTTVSDPVLGIDTDNRELWVYVQPGVIHVLNLPTGEWTTITIGDDLKVASLLYIKPEGESVREMYAVAYDSAAATDGVIVKLRASQNQDDTDGTETDVSAVYALHPLKSGAPRQEITVESLAIDHEITGSQTGSTLTVAFSFDGGVTYGKENNVTITPLSTGATDVPRCEVPLWLTHSRAMVRLTFTGSAGPTYFNFSGGDLNIQTRGREIPRSTPTNNSNTL